MLALKLKTIRKVSVALLSALAVVASSSAGAGAVEEGRTYDDVVYSDLVGGTAEEAISKLLPYVVNEDGRISFDFDRAQTDGVSDAVLIAGEVVEEIGAAESGATAVPPAGASDEFVFYGLGWRVHGNWCGPGHSGPGAPIDTLDGICMRHDQCYGRSGYWRDHCDRALIHEILDNWGRMGAWERTLAAGTATLFASKVGVDCSTILPGMCISELYRRLRS